MMWARGSEKALKEGSMETWYQTQLDDLQGLITKIRSDLTSLQRKCVVALVTTDVHARDIVEDLKNKGVSTEWTTSTGCSSYGTTGRASVPTQRLNFASMASS